MSVEADPSNYRKQENNTVAHSEALTHGGIVMVFKKVVAGEWELMTNR